MFAWHLGPSYGSKNGLHMVGTVAGAPPSQFAYIYDALQTSPYRFYCSWRRPATTSPTATGRPRLPPC